MKSAVLEHGYRAIDEATVYENEEQVGAALKEIFEAGTIKREDIFVTTKLWRSGYKDAEAALRDSLKKLNLEYIDLYLVHWWFPVIDHEKNEVQGPPMHEVWRQMEGLVEKGLAKSIGVSNASCQTLLDILTYAKIKPAVN